MVRQIIFLLTLLFSANLFGQKSGSNNDTSTLIRKDFEKTANWISADSDRHFYYLKYGDTMTLDKAIKVIKHEKDFWTFLQAKTYCIDNFRNAIPKLVSMLTDTTKVGLTNTADLIIWDRLQTKELKWYGHGGVISEDIFTVSGRCSYILNELTGENFALVHVATTTQELKVYQVLWTSWFSRL